MEICKTCMFYKSVEGPRGYCMVDPPKVLLMPMQAQRANIQAAQLQPEMVMQPISVRPVVTETEFCGQWDEIEEEDPARKGISTPVGTN